MAADLLADGIVTLSQCLLLSRMRTGLETLVDMSLMEHVDIAMTSYSSDSVVSSIHNLMEKYGTEWGGVGGWEYFNSLPDSSQPWEWPIMMKNAMQQQKTKLEAAARAKELAAREAEAQPRIWSRLFGRFSSSVRDA